MPEGPEVRCVANELHSLLQGATIISFKLYDKAKGTNLESISPGLVVQRVYSRGKKLILDFGKAQLVSSLAMEGKFRFEHLPHTHFRFIFSLDGEEKKVYYVDHRFGSNRFCEDQESFNDALKNVGRDLLQDDVTEEEYIIKLDQSKRCAISNWVSDQTRFSGVGNYLRSEILYAAKIHPKRKISSLTLEEKVELYKASRTIIQTAYECGGLTIRSYETPNGKKGLYNPKVYMKDEDPDGEAVVKMKASNGQTIHYVPTKQVMI